MKISKIILLLVCSVFVLVSCKKEASAPEEVTVEYNEEEKKPIAENATIAKAKFNIDGMTCAVGCAAKIEKSLAKMDGVASAKVDFETKTAEVSYDVDQVTTSLLSDRVAKTGSMYKVKNMQTITE
ncbi:heavy-metal-associated domain-containing protein [Pseudofulvibacter geojedonensis]|uniref:Heavy-metal-associated domain-containing protein n=1 Tax=Pseudofulvibacter geojedonensis TaxID=1123758 RepID=A0ABW3I1Q9_9FLAO